MNQVNGEPMVPKDHVYFQYFKDVGDPVPAALLYLADTLWTIYHELEGKSNKKSETKDLIYDVIKVLEGMRSDEKNIALIRRLKKATL